LRSQTQHSLDRASTTPDFIDINGGLAAVGEQASVTLISGMTAAVMQSKSLV
jgi:hypothetical protein